MVEEVHAEEEEVVEKQNCWQKVWPQIFFLLFGIGNAVTTKFAVICESTGLPEYSNPHKFQKPWMLTTICFFAMMCALPIYYYISWRDKRMGGSRWMMPHELSLKAFCEFAIPAFSDAFEGIVSAVCIVFVGVSIDSMMKSGTLVGVSLIARWIFKQHYHRWQWIAIVGVVISLTIVGASGIIAAGNSTTVTTARVWVVLIIGLKYISQVGYAVKISYEEYFVQKLDYHPVMICGVEGLWSFLMCLLCQIIAQYMPGEEGNGIREDTRDTFEMVKNNSGLWGIIVVSWFLGLTYNCVSTTLIGRTSAVIRTLMESFRTFLIWMVQFIIYYGLSTADPNSEAYKFRMAGEDWSIGAYVQLAGFSLMTFSLFLYNGIPHYPCFNYGPVHYKGADKEAQLDELGSDGKKLVSPGQRTSQSERGADGSLRIVSEIETNVSAESVTPRPGEHSDQDDSSQRSMSVDGMDGGEGGREPKGA
jgi:hypothetical protein